MEVLLIWLLGYGIPVAGLLWLHILLWQKNRPMMIAYLVSSVLMCLMYPIALFINFEIGVGVGVFFGLICMVTFWGGLFGWTGFGLLSSLFVSPFSAETNRTETYRNGYSESQYRANGGSTGVKW